MKNNIYFVVIVLALLLFTNACKSSKSKSGDVVKVAVEQAVAEEGTAEGQAEESDLNKMYPTLAHRDFVVPRYEGKIVPYSDASENTEKLGMIYTYGREDFVVDYKAQLALAGFEQRGSSNDCFVKEAGPDNVLIVDISGGEGEVVVGMYTGRDIVGRYTNIPDKRIPYPLDENCLAAEYAQYEAPNEASNETVYVYYNRTLSFVAEYEARLQAAGFEKSDEEGSPNYNKLTDDDMSLSVGIDIMADNGGELRIRMMAMKVEGE